MSPEQARGKTVDKRADIWAFGAVLYEMLTGRRAFAGEDITDTIVSVISKEPDWSALPASTSASVRVAVAALSGQRSQAASARHRGHASVTRDRFGSSPDTSTSARVGRTGRVSSGLCSGILHSFPRARPPRTCPIHLLDLYQKHMSGAGVEERFVPSDQQQLVGGRSLSAVLQHRSEDEHRPLGGADDPPISCFVPALGCAVLQGRGDASAISGVI
ncbi:MAG: hypothetical protein DMF89_13460 [Acidobacteria bacterium]|nr:MAG: hypothetical protein DMF89_13460 [Acidobacteriota bacterium]